MITDNRSQFDALTILDEAVKDGSIEDLVVFVDPSQHHFDEWELDVINNAGLLVNCRHKFETVQQKHKSINVPTFHYFEFEEDDFDFLIENLFEMPALCEEYKSDGRVVVKVFEDRYRGEENLDHLRRYSISDWLEYTSLEDPHGAFDDVMSWIRDAEVG